MNKKFVESKRFPIRYWLGRRNVRIRQTFQASLRQREFIDRVNKVRGKILAIPAAARVYIAIGTDPLVVKYLLELTTLDEKNIAGVIGNSAIRINNVKTDDLGQIRVKYPSEVNYSEIDYIVVADLNEKTRIARDIRQAGYKGNIVEIYDAVDSIPFYHVPIINYLTESDDKIDYNNNFNNFSCIADDYYFDMLNRIDKINAKVKPYRDKKILIYCVGAHTNALLKYTDLKHMNIVGFVDKTSRKYRGREVLPPEKESFRMGDCVIISSFRYQDEIFAHLKSINLDIPIITLYDEDEVAEFYKNKNIYSPDFKYPAYVFRKYDTNEVFALAEKNMQKLTATSNSYVTYSIANNCFYDNMYDVYYPGEPEVVREKNYCAVNKNTAVILQGPIVHDDNFTYNTIRHYKMLFPEAKIILSTWKSEGGKDDFCEFEDLGIEIVLSDVPEIPGVLNLNYQVLSTYNGLRKASEMGCSYALKTRTDFRIYAEECIVHLCKLMQLFPVKDGLVEKLTVLPPILDIPYYIPDFIMFGRTEDMLRFWSADKLYPNKSVDVNPEMMLFSRYFKLIGKYLDDPIEKLDEYIKILSKYFIVVNASAFKYIWRKYTYESSMTYEDRKNTLNFADWLNHQTL